MPLTPSIAIKVGAFESPWFSWPIPILKLCRAILNGSLDGFGKINSFSVILIFQTCHGPMKVLERSDNFKRSAVMTLVKHYPVGRLTFYFDKLFSVLENDIFTEMTLGRGAMKMTPKELCEALPD
jgi:hypothetical protein